MRVRELAEWLGATFEGDGEKELAGVAPIETAGAGDLAFIDSRKAVKQAQTSAAGCLIVPSGSPNPGGRTVILVQSGVKPDWNYAFQNAGFLLAAPAETKLYEPRFALGQRLRFRLAANPTRKLSRNSRERDGKPVAEKWI